MLAIPPTRAARGSHSRRRCHQSFAGKIAFAAFSDGLIAVDVRAPKARPELSVIACERQRVDVHVPLLDVCGELETIDEQPAVVGGALFDLRLTDLPGR